MSGIIYLRSKQVIIIIVTFMLLVTPALAGAAGKAQKGHTTKKTKAKSAKAQTAPIPQIDEGTVRTAFETFTQEWMAKLAEAEEYHRKEQAKVTQTSDGFSAEYVGYLPQRSIEVKKTAYDDTPFVGTLSYYERTLRCTGKTKEEALQGPFQQVDTIPVREIFRFTNGKWVY